MEERLGMKSELEDDIIYLGPSLRNEEIDEKFNKLYEKLLDYTNSIFELVEKLCPSCEDQVNLAYNIAKTDGNLLQRLVAKECERRRELMRVYDESRVSKGIQRRPITIHELQDLVYSNLRSHEGAGN